MVHAINYCHSVNSLNFMQRRFSFVLFYINQFVCPASKILSYKSTRFTCTILHDITKSLEALNLTKSGSAKVSIIIIIH